MENITMCIKIIWHIFYEFYIHIKLEFCILAKADIIKEGLMLINSIRNTMTNALILMLTVKYFGAKNLNSFIIFARKKNLITKRNKDTKFVVLFFKKRLENPYRPTQF